MPDYMHFKNRSGYPQCGDVGGEAQWSKEGVTCPQCLVTMAPVPPDDWKGPYRAILNPDGLFEPVPDRRGPGNHDTPGVIDMGIVAHPWMPKDRVLLVQHDSLLDRVLRASGPVWRDDPFDRPRIPRSVYDSERSKALDFLAGLLDDWCETTTVKGVPLSPDKVWRNPRISARESRNRHLNFVMDERVSMAIHRDISAVIKVVP